jgi:hypothetical protein
MLGLRLVQLIEKHSDELALGLTDKLRTSERTRDFRKIPREELCRATADVYHNLGEWLLRKTEEDVEKRFRAVAARRAAEGVQLHQFLWSLIISRNYLWQFLRTQAFADDVVALYGKLELLQILHQFFDRAMYYGVLGYESTRDPNSATSAASEGQRWVAK